MDVNSPVFTVFMQYLIYFSPGDYNYDVDQERFTRTDVHGKISGMQSEKLFLCEIS